MNQYHSEIAFNNQLQINPGGAYHIGNATTPLDFAARIPGPTALGAGQVPPAGIYATHLDVSTSMHPLGAPPKTVSSTVLLVAAALILMYI